jgi:hypothetical protein
VAEVEGARDGLLGALSGCPGSSESDEGPAHS